VDIATVAILQSDSAGCIPCVRVSLANVLEFLFTEEENDIACMFVAVHLHISPATVLVLYLRIQISCSGLAFVRGGGVGRLDPNLRESERAENFVCRFAERERLPGEPLKRR